MIIAVCLVIMTILTLFSVILGSSWTGALGSIDIGETIIVNGTSQDFAIQGIDFSLNIDPVSGFISSIIVIVSIAAILGINIVSSGLSDSAVRIMTMGIVYTSIWTTLSTLSAPLIKSIEIFGALIYIVLTIAYAVGVVQKIDGESG